MRNKNLIKRCEFCRASFKTWPCRIKISWGRFCSRSCRAKILNYGFKKGHTIRPSKEARKRQGLKMKKYRGEKCWNWKGDKISKKGIHVWLIRTYGKPSTFFCEICNKKAEDWSCIDHNYKRKKENFRTLCRKCHMNYDLKMGFR